MAPRVRTLEAGKGGTVHRGKERRRRRRREIGKVHRGKTVSKTRRGEEGIPQPATPLSGGIELKKEEDYRKGDLTEVEPRKKTKKEEKAGEGEDSIAWVGQVLKPSPACARARGIFACASLY